MPTDPKPEGRVRDPELLRNLHLEWRECALCLAVQPLSLHHVCKHPRDDVRANLVMLCGSGTTGCHGLVELRDTVTLIKLGRHVLLHRPDVIHYRVEQIGEEAAREWFRRHLWLES